MIVYGVMIDGAALEHDYTRYFYPLKRCLEVMFLTSYNFNFQIVINAIHNLLNNLRRFIQRLPKSFFQICFFLQKKNKCFFFKLFFIVFFFLFFF